MTPQQAADQLNGNEYNKEGSKELFKAMAAAGLVAIWGASDDLAEIRGAVDDEVGAQDETQIYFTKEGLPQNDCDEEECPYFARLLEKAATITAFWNSDGFSWRYETDIPHATFIIKEDGTDYCRGIVFALADVKMKGDAP